MEKRPVGRGLFHFFFLLHSIRIRLFLTRNARRSVD